MFRCALILAAVLAGCQPTQPAAVPVARTGVAAEAEPDVAPAGERVENPVYAQWAVFAPGATATQKATKKSPTHQVVTTTVYKLLARTDEAVTIETTMTIVDHNNVVIQNPPEKQKYSRHFTLPPGVKKEEVAAGEKVLAKGEETVTALGRPFRTTWIKNKGATEAGPMVATTWTSAEVPGGIVKSFSETPDGKVSITIELIALDVPK